MGKKIKSFTLVKTSETDSGWFGVNVSGTLTGDRSDAWQMKEAEYVQDYVRHVAPVLTTKPLSNMVDPDGEFDLPGGSGHTGLQRVTHGFWVNDYILNLADPNGITDADRKYMINCWPVQSYVYNMQGMAAIEDLIQSSGPPNALISDNILSGTSLIKNVNENSYEEKENNISTKVLQLTGDYFFNEDDSAGVYVTPLRDNPVNDYAKSLNAYGPYNISTADTMSWMGYLSNKTLTRQSFVISTARLSDEDFSITSGPGILSASYDAGENWTEDSAAFLNRGLKVLRHIGYLGFRLDGEDSE